MNTRDFTLVNLDTDSISFSKPDGSPFTEDEQVSLLAELNSLFPPKIRFEHDGVYDTVVILKAKNYILKALVCKKCKKAGGATCNHEEAKITKKGSSLKSSKIEPALKDFMSEVINSLLAGRKDDLLPIYYKYVRAIHNIQDISPYCSKRTITEAVLNPGRTNEEKVLDALAGRPVQMGDKIYTYYQVGVDVRVPLPNDPTKTKKVTQYALKLKEDWTEGDQAIDKLLKRLYDTLVIFDAVIDMSQVPKFHLKGKEVRAKLEEVLKS